MKRLLPLILLLLATPVWGDVPLDVQGDIQTVRVVKSFSQPVVISAQAGAVNFWTLPPGVVYEENDKGLSIKSAPNGPLEVKVKTVTAIVDSDGKFKGLKTDFGSVLLHVGIVTPTPEPTPTPIPIPAGDVKVLIVYESADLRGYPPSQLYGILQSGPMRDKLNKLCGRGNYRIWDQNVPTNEVSKFWQDAMSRPRGAPPFYTVYVGAQVAQEGPLPKTGPEFDTILVRWGLK